MENLPHLDLDNSGKQVASYKRSSTHFFVWTCGRSNVPDVECCLEKPSLPHNNMKHCLCDNMNHIGLRFLLIHLKKLDLSYCSLGDEEMGSAYWELPNLKTLHLSGNKFSRLNFNLLLLPQLKWLTLIKCHNLVELLELPSSITVVLADDCRSLESFGDISNCKWLWNVSLQQQNKLIGDILLDSMLQGNATEDYFINIILEHQIPKSHQARGR
ncbi:unnamed protein product [Lactuca virosa]|uniref:Leucine-rich repeat domain, L domain-containing protein n=1 Tax=Lactuca virosa TaxID=75947 RepID=A0AAU9MYX6_9ASTR|nr:unnamed protein product [Lactuca virosa]